MVTIVTTNSSFRDPVTITTADGRDTWVLDPKNPDDKLELESGVYLVRYTKTNLPVFAVNLTGDVEIGVDRLIPGPNG